MTTLQYCLTWTVNLSLVKTMMQFSYDKNNFASFACLGNNAQAWLDFEKPILMWQPCSLEQKRNRKIDFFSHYDVIIMQQPTNNTVTDKNNFTIVVYEWWRWSGEWERIFINCFTTLRFQRSLNEVPLINYFQSLSTECHLFLILSLFSTDILFISETSAQSQTLTQTVHKRGTFLSSQGFRFLLNHTLKMVIKHRHKKVRDRKQRSQGEGNPLLERMEDEERRDIVWKKWVTLNSCLWPTLFCLFLFQ